ncbi:MAG: hypothetical protein U1F77_03840 [Kiritimatiellia bacterium]
MIGIVVVPAVRHPEAEGFDPGERHVDAHRSVAAMQEGCGPEQLLAVAQDGEHDRARLVAAGVVDTHGRLEARRPAVEGDLCDGGSVRADAVVERDPADGQRAFRDRFARLRLPPALPEGGGVENLQPGFGGGSGEERQEGEEGGQAHRRPG